MEKIYRNVGNFSVATDDITALSADALKNLSVGDKVMKITGKQKHTYVVTYKGEGIGEGLCLTYTDASTVETVSYDLKATGWEYNSTDKTELGGGGGTQLYKHTITFKDFSGNCEIISTSSTPATSWADVENLFNTLHLGYYNNPTLSNFGQILYLDFTNDIYKYIDGSLEFSVVTFTPYEEATGIATDTVTPL